MHPSPLLADIYVALQSLPNPSAQGTSGKSSSATVAPVESVCVPAVVGAAASLGTLEIEVSGSVGWEESSGAMGDIISSNADR